jgi:hypothetical protein
LWLLIALLTTKNPNYTRLLILLPFIAWLTVEGLAAAGNGLQRLLAYFFTFSPRHLGRVLVGAGACIIIVLNLRIMDDFITAGSTSGNDLGTTARYVMQRADQRDYTFYLAADAAHPYFSWNEPAAWQGWIAAFSRPGQTVSVISPADVTTTVWQRPFSIFMSAEAWRSAASYLAQYHPDVVVRQLTPDGRLVAIEAGE